jgi:hypothetical protein
MNVIEVRTAPKLREDLTVPMFSGPIAVHYQVNLLYGSWTAVILNWSSLKY